MNGSENGYAGALFFTLVSLGALLKVDEIVGWIIGAVAALLAAICLKKAINQAAGAAEEDIQRMEIQLQQLRAKVGESANAMTSATDSINETSEIVRENLQGIRSRMADFDALPQIAETSSAVGAVLKSLEENTNAANSALEKISETIQTQEQSAKDFAEKFSQTAESLNSLTEEIKKFNEIGETNKTTLQTGLKLLTAGVQMIKTPAFAEDLGKISASVDSLVVASDNFGSVKEKIETAQNDIGELVRVSEKISEQYGEVVSASGRLETSVREVTGHINDAVEGFKEVTAQLSDGSTKMTTNLEEMRRDITKLTSKLDAYNGLTKATLEQYSTMTEQDVRILEKIAEKVSSK